MCNKIKKFCYNLAGACRAIAARTYFILLHTNPHLYDRKMQKSTSMFLLRLLLNTNGHLVQIVYAIRVLVVGIYWYMNPQ